MRGLVSATNLSALADELRGQPAYRPLIGAVGRVAAVLTVQEDLLEARQCLALVAAIAEDRLFDDETIGQTTIAGAVFDKAIILYARATAQGGNQRDDLLQEDRLDPALRDKHKKIMLLRNQCVAHFGHGESVDGGPIVRVAVSWSEYRVDGRQAFAVAAVANRAQHRAEVVGIISELIDAQLKNLEPIWDKAQRKLHAEMKRRREIDPAFEVLAARFPFDPDELVADASAATRLRLGIERARVSRDEYCIQRPKR